MFARRYEERSSDFFALRYRASHHIDLLISRFLLRCLTLLLLPLRLQLLLQRHLSATRKAVLASRTANPYASLERCVTLLVLLLRVPRSKFGTLPAGPLRPSGLEFTWVRVCQDRSWGAD